MIPWRREWLPIPVFLPGKFHGQRSMAGYSSWGFNMTEWLILCTLTNYAQEFLLSHIYTNAWETEIQIVVHLRVERWCLILVFTSLIVRLSLYLNLNWDWAGLKLSIKKKKRKTEIMTSGPITSWQIEGGKWKHWQILFSWAPKSLRMVTAAMK